MMEFIDLKAEVKRLMAAGEPEQAGIIEAYMDTWPDIRGFRSRWGDLRFCSYEANEVALEVELEHQAAVNDHTPMEVWLFVAVGPNDKLYTYPPCFVVADAPACGFGEIPREGWDDLMEEMDIRPAAINKVRDYLERHAPCLYEELDKKTANG